MDSKICEKLWEYYIKTAEETGKDPTQKDGQAAYSLYTAFYGKEKNQDYGKQNNLIKAFLGDDKASAAVDENESFNEKVERIIRGIDEKHLNSEQREAIRNGLVTPITIVQGPPGTGKTEMILYFLYVVTMLDKLESCEESGNSEEKKAPRSVAVVSCNNEAIKNITDKLDEYVKKNSEGREDFSEVHNRCATLGNKSKVNAWLKDHPEDKENYYINKEFIQPYIKKYPLFTSTIHSLPKLFAGKMIFDYVIVDESSQVSVTLGLVAMAHAKHLIVVGDNQQLQAIVDPVAIKTPEQFREDYLKKYNVTVAAKNDELQKRLEENGKSFLKACEDIFPGAPDIMLKNHYRCHPSIAGFFNKYVYGGQLNIMQKASESDLRIGIVYYDGKFSENLFKSGRMLTDSNRTKYEKTGPLSLPSKDEKNFPSQRCNFRQIRIFMEEIFPRIKEKLQAAKDQNETIPSISVLSPYRVQIEVLKDELTKAVDNDEKMKDLFEKSEIKIEIEKDPNSDEEKEKKESKYDLQGLSIHKSQGRGYDYVYLMTAEDDDKNDKAPWGQDIRKVNVAVSRAKKGVFIITSRIWIPRYIQKTLLGYSESELAPRPLCLNNKELSDDPGEEKFYAPDSDKEDYYIGRLCQYVSDYYKNGSEDFGEFGFIKARADSDFDKFHGESNNSAALKTLVETEFGKKNVHLASLNDTDTLGEDSRIKIERDFEDDEMDFEEIQGCFSEQDFLYVCEENNIKAIVHILDKSYRDACGVKYRFQKMLEKHINEIAGGIYVQIPTNGSSSRELEAIRKACKTKTALPLKFDSSSFKRMLNEITSDCISKVNEYIDGGLNKKKLDTLDIDFRFPQDVKYDDENRQNYYFCRYGTAYAFEYAMMYDIVFKKAFLSAKSKETPKFNILSLGCGSGLDGFAAAYAKANCKANCGREITLTYHGVDCREWQLDLLEPVQEHFTGAADRVFCDVVKYFAGANAISQNVIFFPKIVNELGKETRERLLEAASGKADPNVSEYYLCFSHSKSQVKDKDGAAFAEKFVEAFNAETQYEVSGDFLDNERKQLGYTDKDGKRLFQGFGKGKCPYFHFAEKYENAKVADLNNDFSDKSADDEMKSIVDRLNAADKKVNPLKSTDRFYNRVMNVTDIAYFQIIRLKKKEGK